MGWRVSLRGSGAEGLREGVVDTLIPVRRNRLYVSVLLVEGKLNLVIGPTIPNTASTVCICNYVTVRRLHVYVSVCYVT